MVLLTIIGFIKKVSGIIAKRKNKIKFPLDSEIEKFLNNDSFGEWISDGDYYYNDMRRLMFHIQNNEIQMTRDYYVHTMSNPGIYFKVSKEDFINVVKA
jgi:hypothetical protein